MFYTFNSGLLKFFGFIVSLSLLFGCSSTEKTDYDEVVEKQSNSFRGKKTISREIAYLKNISQFEDNKFQFIAKQMKEVIKNYGKMRKKLNQMEDKLDHFLDQMTLKNQERMQNADEIEEVDFSEEENPTLDESDREAKEPPLLEEEITDETDIFPKKEDIGKNKKSQNQKKALAKNRTAKDSPKNKASDLAEARKLFEEQSYQDAISKFEKYRTENPKGKLYPEATFYIGQSFQKLKMPIEAEIFFKEIVKSHPQSLWASMAKKLLKE